ncbi:SEC10/PgrA surface exclusion domain-containing protein [Gemella sp. 27098_8_149]|uniref:SEC10/PgrA surface exclusion domain-containing protein n=1 Tax=Gemella sp. 27098_8_149 TaxID=3003689 RepID=UPI00352DFD0D
MIKRKQRFSLRKNKIGTASVLLGLTIVGASYTGSQVQAADVPVETTVKQDKTYTVSDEQVLDAKKKVNDKKVEIDNKTKEVDLNKNEIATTQNEKNELEKKVDSLVKDIDEGKKITPDVIEGVKNDIKKAETDKATKEQEFDQAQRDKAAKLNAKNTADEKVKDAQKAADEADKDVDLKKKAFDPGQIDIAKNKLTEAEKILNEKQKQNDNAQKELDDAKVHDEDLANRRNDANTDLNNKKQNREEKQHLLDEAKRKQQEAKSAVEKFPYPTKFLATKEWLDAFNKFRSIHNERFDMKAWEAKNPITDDTDPEEYAARMDKAMDEFYADKNSRELDMIKKLQVIENSQPKANSLKYGNKTDDKITYEINNLPQDVHLELSQYFAHLVNDARSQLGISDKIKVHLDAIEFAKEVAKSVVDNNATVDGHFGRGINDAARKRGLATSADPGVDTEKQYYENLMVSKRSDNTVTRSELFAYLYKYFNIFMHEGALSGHYNHALSLISSKNVGVSFSHLQDGTFKLHAISINPGFVKNDNDNVEYEKRYGAATLLDNVDYPDRDVLQKAYDDAIKDVEKATQELDKATKDVTDAQNKVDELSKIKEKTQDAQIKFNKAAKDLQDAEKEKQKAEENLRNVTADQDSKQRALNDALNVQKQKHDELNKAKDDANRAQKEYEDALKACKDKHEDLKIILDKIQSLTKKKKDMEDKVAKFADNEKELVKVKAQLQDIVNKLTNLLQTQTKLSDQLQKLISELKDLEKEYNRLLQIYTNERMQEPPIDPKPFIDIKEEVKEEELDYRTVEQNDPTLEEGKRVVKVKGKKGRKSIKTITLSENGKVLDVVTQETILEDVVDEVVLVGTKKPGDKPEDKAPSSSNNQPDLQRPSVNSNGLKTLPNTGESQSGMATVAGLVALAVAARLRKKDKQN